MPHPSLKKEALLSSPALQSSEAIRRKRGEKAEIYSGKILASFQAKKLPHPKHPSVDKAKPKYLVVFSFSVDKGALQVWNFKAKSLT